MDDTELWDQYEAARAAGDGETCRQLRTAIVDMHRNFAFWYATRTAPDYWHADQVDEYAAELIIVMLNRVDTYDRSRGASFPTYCKPYFLPVRPKLSGRARAIPRGYETERIASMISYLIDTGHSPDPEDLARTLSERHGKKIQAGRVARIMAHPTVHSLDFTMDSGDSAGSIVPAGEDIEAAVVDADERDGIATQVRAALAALDLGPLELDIVTRVLMAEPRNDDRDDAPGPMTDAALAELHGVPRATVTECREALVENLRFLLG